MPHECSCHGSCDEVKLARTHTHTRTASPSASNVGNRETTRRSLDNRIAHGRAHLAFYYFVFDVFVQTSSFDSTCVCVLAATHHVDDDDSIFSFIRCTQIFAFQGGYGEHSHAAYLFRSISSRRRLSQYEIIIFFLFSFRFVPLFLAFFNWCGG